MTSRHLVQMLLIAISMACAADGEIRVVRVDLTPQIRTEIGFVPGRYEQQPTLKSASFLKVTPYGNLGSFYVVHKDHDAVAARIPV